MSGLEDSLVFLVSGVSQPGGLLVCEADGEGFADEDEFDVGGRATGVSGSEVDGCATTLASSTLRSR